MYDPPSMPCNPSPCGANAICKERNGAGSCACVSEFYGDPYTGCRPECVMNTDCPRSLSCINNKCKDPCPGTCGINAECRVVNHSPTCTCFNGYIGNALSACSLPSKNYFIFQIKIFVNFFCIQKGIVFEKEKFRKIFF